MHTPQISESDIFNTLRVRPNQGTALPTPEAFAACSTDDQ